MARFKKTSKIECKEVIEKATLFFASDGIGLEVASIDKNSATFKGGGGYVNIECCKVAERAEITIATREWDAQVKRFMTKV